MGPDEDAERLTHQRLRAYARAHPAVYLVAPLGILVNLSMMMFLSPKTWLRLLVWLIVGLVFYVLYGRRHSQLAKEMGLGHGSKKQTRPSRRRA